MNGISGFINCLSKTLEGSICRLIVGSDFPSQVKGMDLMSFSFDAEINIRH